ncbi:MAG: NAD-dependent epimerase/dehydratase family protein [Patescibacteria group bacterium]|jgi:nucleoside-diphosphate-sugar epimerase
MKILVTGAFGLIGSNLVPTLQEKYGKDNVIALAHSRVPENFDGLLEKGDVCNQEFLDEIIKKHGITQIYHLASLLSAGAEKNPQAAWEINLLALKTILDLAVENKIKVFWPSSIAVFGPTTPRQNTPQHTILEPTTLYGTLKVSGELLCQYYFLRYGLDVRSVRYPGLISYKTDPGDGTTEYAIHIFYGALKEGKYTCFLKEGTTLPMMYMDDAINGTIKLMETDPEKLTVRTSYNLNAISFAPEEIAAEIKKHLPDFECRYEPDFKQKIAESWPQSVDDSQARKDWGWLPEFDLPKMTKIMLEGLKERLNIS